MNKLKYFIDIIDQEIYNLNISNYNIINNEYKCKDFVELINKIFKTISPYIDLKFLKNYKNIFKTLNDENLFGYNNFLNEIFHTVYNLNDHNSIINLLIFLKNEYVSICTIQDDYLNINLLDFLNNNWIETKDHYFSIKPYYFIEKNDSTEINYDLKFDKIINVLNDCKYYIIKIINLLKKNIIVWMYIPDELVEFYLYIDSIFDYDQKYINYNYEKKSNNTRLYDCYGVKKSYKNIVNTTEKIYDKSKFISKSIVERYNNKKILSNKIENKINNTPSFNGKKNVTKIFFS